jgi:hypothetical protein
MLHRIKRTRFFDSAGSGKFFDMRLVLDNPPSEPALLQHLVRDMAAAAESRDGEIDQR